MAREAGGRPFSSHRLLNAGYTAYYPDVLVVCGRAAHRLYETDAQILVEVLSPATTDVDRREKAAAYVTLPGLTAYALVNPDVRRIGVAVPDGDGGLRWLVYGPGDAVPIGTAVLDLDAFSAAIDRTATS